MGPGRFYATISRFRSRKCQVLARLTAFDPGSRIGMELYVSSCGYHCDDRSGFPPALTSLRAGQILKVRPR
jgi:hypothetical protein